MPRMKAMSASPEVLRALRRLSKQMSLPSYLRKRIRIILKCADGLSNEQVAKSLHVDRNTVSRWKIRFIHSEFGQGGEFVPQDPKNKDKELCQKLLDLVSDEERSGHPSKFTADQVIQIQNLACERPGDHGIEAQKWTLSDLKHKAEELGLVDSISTSTIACFLKNKNRSPRSFPGDSTSPHIESCEGIPHLKIEAKQIEN